MPRGKNSQICTENNPRTLHLQTNSRKTTSVVFFDKMRFGVVGSHQPYLIHQCLIQTATGHKQLGAISTPHGFVHMSNLFVVRM